MAYLAAHLVVLVSGLEAGVLLVAEAALLAEELEGKGSGGECAGGHGLVEDRVDLRTQHQQQQGHEVRRGAHGVEKRRHAKLYVTSKAGHIERTVLLVPKDTARGDQGQGHCS